MLSLFMKAKLPLVITGPIYTTHVEISGSSLMTSQWVRHPGKSWRRRVWEDTTMLVPTVSCMWIKPEPCQRMVSAYCLMYVDKTRAMPENGKCLLSHVCG